MKWVVGARNGASTHTSLCGASGKVHCACPCPLGMLSTGPTESPAVGCCPVLWSASEGSSSRKSPYQQSSSPEPAEVAPLASTDSAPRHKPNFSTRETEVLVQRVALLDPPARKVWSRILKAPSRRTRPLAASGYLRRPSMAPAHLNLTLWALMESSMHHLRRHLPSCSAPTATFLRELWACCAFHSSACTASALLEEPSSINQGTYFEQLLLDLHRHQDALLANWSQQQSTLMAQQNLIASRPPSRPLSIWWQYAPPRKPRSQL
uniref:t-SNARE domain-containing protein 1 isoform X2 n=1 Tax=Jaculus jaculus TaxID=51337 RepID=UPI001E1B46B8|nr:t-SNARE domain-containing protein 1 isoform X2 [Jaculus jaculus]